MAELTDTELLNWFEEKGGISGAALVNDDNGHWAVSATGHQSIQPGPGPHDVETCFFIEAKDWKPTLREAILQFKMNYEEDEGE